MCFSKYKLLCPTMLRQIVVETEAHTTHGIMVVVTAINISCKGVLSRKFKFKWSYCQGGDFLHCSTILGKVLTKIQ